MLPDFRDGDALLVDAGAYSESLPIRGDVVLVAHPFRRGVKMIKRVDHITIDGKVFVLGDNQAESTDSRSFGPVRADRIVGRVVERLPHV